MPQIIYNHNRIPYSITMDFDSYKKDIKNNQSQKENEEEDEIFLDNDIILLQNTELEDKQMIHDLNEENTPSISYFNNQPPCRFEYNTDNNFHKKTSKNDFPFFQSVETSTSTSTSENSKSTNQSKNNRFSSIMKFISYSIEKLSR